MVEKRRAKSRTILRGGITRWAQMLAHSRGIRVLFSGSQPRTDGKTVHVFALPDEIDSVVERAIIGAVDHECSHVDPEFGSKLGNSRVIAARNSLVEDFGPLGHLTWNALEDARIEHAFLQRFRGGFKYFHGLRKWMHDNQDAEDKEKMLENSASQAICAMGYLRFPDLFREIILPRVSQEILALIQHWSHYLWRAELSRDVFECFKIARELLEELKEMAENSEGEGGIESGLPNESGEGGGEGGGEGEGEGEGSGQGGSGGSGQGRMKKSDMGGSGGAKDGKDKASGKDGESGDDGGKEEGGGSGSEDAAGSESGKQGKGGRLGGWGPPEKGTGDEDGEANFNWDRIWRDHGEIHETGDPDSAHAEEALRKAMRDGARQVMEHVEDDDLVVPDFGTESLEKLSEEVDNSMDYRSTDSYILDEGTTRVTQVPEKPSIASQVAAEGKGMYPVLRQRMRKLLEGRKAGKYKGDLEYGRLDPRKVFTLSMKNGPINICRRFERGRKVDTSALMLIDGSSSMSGDDSQAVMRCAYFFAHALGLCSIPTEVAVFQNDWDGHDSEVKYMVVKAFDQRLAKAKNCFFPQASGGTPMAEGMLKAMERIAFRRESRKILFVLTDGQPNGGRGDPCSFMIRLADHGRRLAAVETIGIGVGQVNSLSRCFRDFIMIDNGSMLQVQKGFIDLLQKKVLAL